MIFECLTDISDQLNQHFKMRFGLTEDKLIISNLVNADGASAVEEETVVMSLVNIQEETHNKRMVAGEVSPVTLNVILLFSTTFTGKQTGEGLKFIAEIISFFQRENVHEVEGNTLRFDLLSLDLSKQQELWSSLGAKYAPSVLYKVGLIAIEDDMPTSEINFATDFPE